MTNPIGIFDSGIGGLTVAKAIAEHLPNENIIYFGDTLHLPYGDKSQEAILGYSRSISQFLLSQDCKMIIIACNSASAAAYDILKEELKDRVLLVDVINPLVKKVIQEDFKKIGVIATRMTIASKVYEQKLKKYNNDLTVHSLATPLLCPMIEEGFFKNEISHAVIHTYLEKKEFEDVETLLLACTHYPLIKKEIQEFFQRPISVLDSTDVVAQQVRNLLEKNNLLNQTKAYTHKFYVSDYTKSFEQTAQVFYKKNIHLEHLVLHD